MNVPDNAHQLSRLATLDEVIALVTSRTSFALDVNKPLLASEIAEILHELRAWREATYQSMIP